MLKARVDRNQLAIPILCKMTYLILSQTVESWPLASHWEDIHPVSSEGKDFGDDWTIVRSYRIETPKISLKIVGESLKGIPLISLRKFTISSIIEQFYVYV